MKSMSLLLLAILSATLSCFSQSENPIAKQTATSFQQYYNAGQPDSIFYMFSADTKQKLPLEKTKGFLSQLRGYGKIKTMQFLRLSNGFNAYKTDMEKGIVQLFIDVNETGAITGLYAKPWEDTTAVQQRNTTAMRLPFSGEWTVFWGGDTKEQNYHIISPMQKNAFDLIITNAANKSYKTNGAGNEDYYVFGENILSPCDAEVLFAVDGIKDNTPGKMNPMYTLGNSVLLKTPHNEYILLAHFKQGSVRVKQGARLKAGQLIAQCGNSGNSSEPHLHFHIQNSEDFSQATGIKCFFSNLLVNGTRKTDYSPVKGEKIQPVQ